MEMIISKCSCFTAFKIIVIPPLYSSLLTRSARQSGLNVLTNDFQYRYRNSIMKSVMGAYDTRICRSGLFLMTEEVKFGSKLLRRRGRGDINTALAHIWPHHLSLTTPLHSILSWSGELWCTICSLCSPHILRHTDLGRDYCCYYSSQSEDPGLGTKAPTIHEKTTSFFYTIELYWHQ